MLLGLEWRIIEVYPTAEVQIEVYDVTFMEGKSRELLLTEMAFLQVVLGEAAAKVDSTTALFHELVKEEGEGVSVQDGA